MKAYQRKAMLINKRTIGGKEVVMKLRPVSRQANFCGFRVNVNDEKDYFVGVLTEQEAFDRAFVRYTKENK